MFQLLSKQQQCIDIYFKELNLERCEKILQCVLSCRGVLFFTGIGKSGFVAQKIAATLMSTGTKAFFLSPIDALHGDLGMISHEDLVLILSKSGETEELLQLIPFLRSRGCKTVAITSNEESRLAKACDQGIELPCKEELCPFGLAPTISTEIQLLFGDLLAIALMQAKNFTLSSYAENHPRGQIGRRASLKVRDFMIEMERTPLCFPEQPLSEVLRDFTDKQCGCLVIIDRERALRGIFTDGDLRRALQARGETVLQERLESLMTTRPKAIGQDALAWEALKLMEADQKRPIMVLPVIDGCKNEVVGIIKMHDLIQAGL
jgi:arabinose-5-phosphate isomerase